MVWYGWCILGVLSFEGCFVQLLKTVHWAHRRWKWQRLAVFRSSTEGEKYNTCQNIGGRQHRTTPAGQILEGGRDPCNVDAYVNIPIVRWLQLGLSVTLPSMYFLFPSPIPFKFLSHPLCGPALPFPSLSPSIPSILPPSSRLPVPPSSTPPFYFPFPSLKAAARSSRAYAALAAAVCVALTISSLNPWPTFSPYLYNRVWSELTCCNSLL